VLDGYGVADGTRTHDDRNQNPGLYQLSYSHRRCAIIAARKAALSPCEGTLAAPPREKVLASPSWASLGLACHCVSSLALASQPTFGARRWAAAQVFGAQPGRMTNPPCDLKRAADRLNAKAHSGPKRRLQLQRPKGSSWPLYCGPAACSSCVSRVCVCKEISIKLRIRWAKSSPSSFSIG
jgi:hypothetical protein